MICFLLILIGVLLFFAASREAASKVTGQLTGHVFKTRSSTSFWLKDINPFWVAKFRIAFYGLFAVGNLVFIGVFVDWDSQVQAIGAKLMFLAVFVFAGVVHANWREPRSFVASRKTVDSEAR